MKKLKALLKDLPEAVVRGNKDQTITGLSSHSKLVAPGNIFIAKKGLQVDGNRFTMESVNSGAVAVLSDLYDPFLPPHVAQIVHPHVEQAEALLAAAYYDKPFEQLFLAGVTGTNGKTTTAYLLRHLLGEKERPCGMIGTVEWDLGQKIQPALQTTPDCITNCRLLREMVNSGCGAAAMEVSSHALDQGRVRNLEFDVAIFTNLTQDHLDYHLTMDNYAAAKAKIFATLGQQMQKPWAKTAVVNADSPWSSRMLADCRSAVLTYGIDKPADLQARDLRLDVTGISFSLAYQGKNVRIESGLIGRFNIYNLLGAIGAALVNGLPLELIAEKVRTFRSVPGRLEKIPNSRGLSVFVDYAHTEDALRNILETLREVTPQNILTVFGCGGDRDRDKRPKMGAVALNLSDFAVITSDNPRHEDPHAIIMEILQGCPDSRKFFIEPDRKNAIYYALAHAKWGDTVLIAGKGHERQQIFGSRVVEFDDCAIAREALDSIR